MKQSVCKDVMQYIVTCVCLALVILLAGAGISHVMAEVGRSTDEERVAIPSKPLRIGDGNQGVVQNKGSLLMGDQNTAIGTEVLQSHSEDWVVGQDGVFRPVETTNIVVLPQPIIQQEVPAESRIQTEVNGIDDIQTTAILPESLVVDQLDAVKQIADNGKTIAQQRFAVEQYRINSEAGLEYLRIVKSFILWGFLASIPFMLTGFFVLKNLLKGYHALQKDRLDHKLKELESAERQIAMTEKNLLHHP